MNGSKAAALRGLAFSMVCGLSAASAGAGDTADGNAMRVAIDRETGKLRAATAQEAAELARLDREARQSQDAGETVPSTEAEALASMRMFDSGFIGMDLPLSLYSSLQATVEPDGSIRIEHVGHGHDEAHAAHEDAEAAEVRREDR